MIYHQRRCIRQYEGEIMTHRNNPSDPDQRFIHAYDRMMEHLRNALEHIEHETRPALGHFIEAAQEKAVELGELSREEAEKIGNYLKRDIEDAAEYLTGPEAKELSDWFKFDIGLIEDRLLELFTSVADKTKLELLQLEQRARRAGEYHTGEITGIGTLTCSRCGEALHFHAAGHIPPCPKCHATTFTRSP